MFNSFHRTAGGRSSRLLIRRAPPSAPPPVYYVQPEPDPSSEDSSAPLARYLGIIRRHAWEIGAFVTVMVITTYAISVRLTPLYESTVIIDVDRQAPSALIGQESYRSSESNTDADQFLATQVKLIQSDAVLRPVAQKLDLVRKEKEQEFVTPLQWFLGRSKFAPAPERAAESPINLKGLKITRPPNTYLVLIRYQSSDPHLATDAANAIAQSYLQHTYDIRVRSSASMASFMEQQTAELKAKMERSGQALARIEQELGVVSPDDNTNIVSSRLLQLNTEFTTVQTDRLKKQAIWNSVQNGSIESLQVSGQAEQLTQLTQKLNEARERLAEVDTTYGSAHPEHRKAASQVEELQRQFESARQSITERVKADYEQAQAREHVLRATLAQAKAQSDHINGRIFEYQQLKREADSDKKLYDELVWKIKEASTNAGFQNNNIRIADIARPGLTPVFPKTGLNVLLAFLFSSFFAVGAAALSEALDTTVRGPEQISQVLASEVIGTLPKVKNMPKAELLEPTYSAAALTSLNVASGNGIPREPGQYPRLTVYSEAIRTLRNTITLGNFGVPIRSVLITSGSLGEGKTTTAVNLAIAHAQHGKRTLLIDADLRQPKLHQVLGVSQDAGLSDVLTNGLGWKKAVQSVKSQPNLFLIPAGPASERASDIVGPHLLDILDELEREYDLVIFDAPPLLGFAEPLDVAKAVDGVLIVTQAGKTKLHDVASVLSHLKRVQANVIGLVVNSMSPRLLLGHSYYGSYQPYNRQNK